MYHSLREELEADCKAAEEQAAKSAEKVKEAQRIKKSLLLSLFLLFLEQRCWWKDQLEWKKSCEAMAKKIELQMEHGNAVTQLQSKQFDRGKVK